MTHTSGLADALADRYRIERELGAGGMATVYLAEDLKHKRRVAVKVLKPELAAVLGAERFVQEIRTTAALQHPHILPLFDSGEADGFLYYVMPFIDGETLRAKLDRETQLGIDESVKIAVAVADALDYAHRHGVIHRDIKPENILLHDGRPTVADFGIALAVSAAAGGRMTETGLSLGTPHYMSPEQATAEKEITARADIYSLGSVLYEMLTGDPPHTGASAQQIIMRIIADVPRLVTEVRKSVPMHVAAAVSKAIEKLPADRFESARAFADALNNPSFTVANTAGAPFAVGGARWKQRAAVPLAAISLVLLVAAGWGWLRGEPTRPVVRFDLALGAAGPVPSSDVVVSPDGSMLAYAGVVGNEAPAVYVRHLDGEPDFRKVAGSEGANASPTFSPDSRSLAFRRSGDGALVGVDASGGNVRVFARIGTEIGSFLHWGTRDQIVYSGGPQGLFLVAAAGGAPRALLKTAGAARYSFLLPDGSGVLFSASAGVMLLDFKTDSATMLVPNGVHPTYIRSGHILYVAEGSLFAIAFDLGRHKLIGPAVRVLERVAAATGQRGYSVSDGGLLVYREGASTVSDVAMLPNRLVIMSFAGDVQPIALSPSFRMTPRFSPSGDRIVYSGMGNRDRERDIHTLDLATGTDTRLTFADDNVDPIWSPDGKQILFSKRRGGGTGEDLFIKLADNSAPERSLLVLPQRQVAGAWLSDGGILLSSAKPGGGRLNLFRYSMKDSTSLKPYRDAPWNETDPDVSPDGKLVAFTSSEGGNPGIWISDYPAANGKWQVSPTLGVAARWSRDGKYVYYWKTIASTGDSLFRARVDRTPAVVVRAPEFLLALAVDNSARSWDLHPDGKRFVVALRGVSAGLAAGAAGAPASRYLVAVNWFAELKEKTRGGSRK